MYLGTVESGALNRCWGAAVVGGVYMREGLCSKGLLTIHIIWKGVLLITAVAPVLMIYSRVQN